MPLIIDPITGRTTDQTRYLELLQAWTTDPQVIKALFDCRQASPQQLVTMAHRVRATTTGEPKEWVLSPVAVVVFILKILEDRRVRRVIAKRTWQKTQGEAPPGTTAQTLLGDLLTLKADLEREYEMDARETRWEQEQRASAAGLILPGGPGDRPQATRPPGAPRIISG